MTNRLVSFVILTSCEVILGGCASHRAVLPPNAKAGLTQIHAAIADGRAEMQAAVISLRALDRSGTEIPSAVKDYSMHVGKLNQTVESTRLRLATSDRPDEFFSSWNADIDSIRDTQLREAGEKRYAAARHELERLNTEINRLRDVFRPFHSELNDVETYLRNDPTRVGVEQVRPKIRKIIRSEDEVLAKTDVVQKGIKQLLR